MNADALLSFFTFGYVAGAQAIFEGMQRLEPGTALVVDARAGTTRVERFWRWPGGRRTGCDAGGRGDRARSAPS